MVTIPTTPEEERADMEKFADIFTKVAGEDVLLDAWELQGILNSVFKKGNSLNIKAIWLTIRPKRFFGLAYPGKEYGLVRC